MRRMSLWILSALLCGALCACTAAPASPGTAPSRPAGPAPARAVSPPPPPGLFHKKIPTSRAFLHIYLLTVNISWSILLATPGSPGGFMKRRFE